LVHPLGDVGLQPDDRARTRAKASPGANSHEPSSALEEDLDSFFKQKHRRGLGHFLSRY